MVESTKHIKGHFSVVKWLNQKNNYNIGECMKKASHVKCIYRTFSLSALSQSAV